MVRMCSPASTYQLPSFSPDRLFRPYLFVAPAVSPESSLWTRKASVIRNGAMHGTTILLPKTLKSILEQAAITEDELREML